MVKKLWMIAWNEYGKWIDKDKERREKKKSYEVPFYIYLLPPLIHPADELVDGRESRNSNEKKCEMKPKQSK